MKKDVNQRTERVKGVDLHPTEPWVLVNLYSGHVHIYSTLDQSLIKSFEVTDLPVRAAKFIARKQWVVVGADDMQMRVYNYNTLDKVKVWEAHNDYIRCLAVHPNMPYVLSSSDDMLIKLWDWERGWQCTQIFEGHTHYIMQVVFNPRDANTFASASLDHTVKVWSVGQPMANYTLEGHEKGVNCVDYLTGGDRPYLVSGSDDRTVKVWDYQTKGCVSTLEGHSQNISDVCFHPELPIIVSGSEDGAVKIWHATTYRLESTLNYGMERVWALAYMKGSKRLGIGYDEGVVVVRLGREEPVVSMDGSGKVVYAKNTSVQTVNIKTIGADHEWEDGEKLPLTVKELGSSDTFPQSLSHSPNGRFVAVCGDGEYTIYTALAWRNKCFGQALDFVWSTDSNEYATRESGSRIKIFRNFKELQAIKPFFTAEGIFGGHLLAVKAHDFVCFYDWSSSQLVRRIDVSAKAIHWSEQGDRVAIVSEEGVFILRFNQEAVAQALATGHVDEGEGVEEAFDLEHEVNERVNSGLWVGDCFIYNTAQWRLNYVVGGEVTTVCHLDRPMYLMGYQTAQDRVYLIDNDFHVVSHTILLTLIEYKTLVMRGDMEGADELFPSLPRDSLNGVAQFLESRGFPEKALSIAIDPEFRFELCMQLGDLQTALQIARETSSATKFKAIGDLSMQSGQLALAESCLSQADDLSGLLLIYSSLGMAGKVEELGAKARKGGKNNVAFLCAFLLGRLDECIEILIGCGRYPEATFFARTYCPKKISACVALWKTDLAKVSAKAAGALAEPEGNPDLFPDFDWMLKAESMRDQQLASLPPAADFTKHEFNAMVDLVGQAKGLSVDDGASSPPEPVVPREPEPESESEPEPEPAAAPEPEPEPEPESAPELGSEPEPL